MTTKHTGTSGVGVPETPSYWLHESFAKFLRSKGFTDEQIAAECAANGLPLPAGVDVSPEPQQEKRDAP